MAISHLFGDGIHYEEATVNSVIETIVQDHGKSILNLTIDQKNDQEVRVINKKFLNHDYYTDVITFINSEVGDLIDTDIVISYERIIDNALKDSIKPITELHRVIFHGVLHLMGYNDSTEKEKEKMTEKEDLYLKYWFHVEQNK